MTKMIYGFLFVLAPLAVPGIAAAQNPNDFYMVTTSDPQLIWSQCAGTERGCNTETTAWPNQLTSQLSANYNDNMIKAINGLQISLTKRGATLGGLIINGDLTSYGQQFTEGVWLLNAYESYYENSQNSLSGIKVWPGLGNHDYANNLRLPPNSIYDITSNFPGCAYNACAQQMMDHQIDLLISPTSSYECSSLCYNVDINNAGSQMPQGSFAYSWEIGNVHFVQLNNYPTYNVTFATISNTYAITSAIPWLRADLLSAVRRGKQIVLNWHEWNLGYSRNDGLAPGSSGSGGDDYRGAFRWGLVPNYNAPSQQVMDVLNSFPISSVYVGHWHSMAGILASSDNNTHETYTLANNCASWNLNWVITGTTTPSPDPLTGDNENTGRTQVWYPVNCTVYAVKTGGSCDMTLVSNNGNYIFSNSTVGTTGGPISAFAAAPAQRYVLTDHLSPGDTLGVLNNYFITSVNGQYSLTMQTFSDGNLVLRRSDGFPCWTSNPAGAGATVTMQGDGNLVIYAAGYGPNPYGNGAKWASNSGGKNGNVLIMQNDGNLIIYDAQNNAPWAAKSTSQWNSQVCG